MNIDLLSKMVKELILDNDVVALPGLGSFVAEMVPATFSDRGYTINPPYRRLYFRENIAQDNLLVNCYAASNGVTVEVAREAVGECMDELKALLDSQKSVVFPGLGKLRATRENNYFFVPFEDADIYPEGIGLEPISLKAHYGAPAAETVAVAAVAAVAATEPVAEEVAELVEAEPVAEEVAKPVETEPVPESAVVAPAVEKVVEEPAAEPMAIEIADDWIVPEFVELASSGDEPVAEQPAAEPAAEESVAEEVVEPVSEEPVEPAAEESAAEESASEEGAEPAPEPIAEEPAVEEALEPAVEPVPEQPAAEEPVAEEVSEQSAAEEPVVEEVAEPAAEEPAEQATEEATEPATAEPAKETSAVAAPASKPVTQPAEKKSAKKRMPKGLKVTLIVLACLVGLAIIAFLLFILLAHVAPDFIDSILYSKEELDIISGVN